MRIHRSDLIYSRGSGTGRVFANVFKRVKPLSKRTGRKVGKTTKKSSRGVKKTAKKATAKVKAKYNNLSDHKKAMIKAVGKTALETGLNVASDMLNGEDLETSLANNAEGIPMSFTRNVIKGSGRKTKTRKTIGSRGGKGEKATGSKAAGKSKQRGGKQNLFASWK